MPIVIPLSYMGVLFILASIPDTGDTTTTLDHLLALVPPTVQNLLHIPAYGLLVLLWLSVLRTHGMAERRSLYVALPLALAFGGITELYQVCVPGRVSSILDFLFDTAGIVSFVWLYQLVQLQDVFGSVKRLFHA